MNKRPDIYFVIAALVFTVLIILTSLTYPYIESKLLPVMIAVILLILSGVQLRLEIKELKGGPAGESPREAAPSYSLTGIRPSAVWIAGFCIALFILGFFVAIPLFVLSYLRWRGRSWGMSIGVSVILTVCIYLIFTTFLQVRLYPGLLYELLS